MRPVMDRVGQVSPMRNLDTAKGTNVVQKGVAYPTESKILNGPNLSI